MSNVSKMKSAIRRMLKEADYRTFANFCRIAGFEGELTLELTGRPNVVLWTSVSADGVQAVKELIEGQEMFMHPASRLSYVIDGGVVSGIPTVSGRVPEKGYKKPRWLPVCFCRFPMDDKN